MHELELRRLQEDSNKRFGELKRAYEQAETRTVTLSPLIRYRTAIPLRGALKGLSHEIDLAFDDMCGREV